MLDDLKIIVHKFPRDIEKINIYPFGDIHVGSRQFNEKLIQHKINRVLDDPFGYVV